ncbi:hypothetical protein [Rubrivirga sp.]|uniref:hypothetical protein n=1 Tax=Rubrivirga sp. TaxID=1885344 RepID=UPI003C7678E9
MMNLVSPSERWSRIAGWAVAALAVGALSYIAGVDLEDGARARMVRYIGILVSAVMAIGVTHVLFPDPRRRALQVVNASPSRLRRRQVRRWAPIPLILSIPALVIGKGWIILEGAFATIVVGWVAFVGASELGPQVRKWESLKGGRWYRALYSWAPPLRFLVPDPLVPGILLTGQIFLVGSGLAIVGQVGGTTAVLAVAIVATARVISVPFDRAFWMSNAVWADAFRQTDSADARDPVAHDSVYWAPASFRPSVWAGLVSLDRRFPLGRVAALGLALIAVAHLAGLSAGVRFASVALYIVVLNGAVVLTALEDVIPGALEVRLGGPARWTAARFLMNARWLPPLLVIRLLLVWLADLPWGTLVVWAAVDLAVAVLSAVLVTFIARLRFRRALA